MCNKALNALKGFIENYFEQKLHSMESNIAQQIQVGSSNFRTEIEGYLSSAELTFGELNGNLSITLNQVANELRENDGRSGKFEGMLVALIGQNRRTQQVLENERGDREKENNEISNKISVTCSAIENNKICSPPTNRRSRKNW